MSQGSDLRGVIESEIQRVLQSSGRSHDAFRDDDILIDKIGLDSLDLAQVVVMLEQRLQVDPFRLPGKRVRTFGDLVQSYAEVLP